MARRLRTQRAALAASESRYRGLFSASPSALLELDEQMTVIAANPAAEPLLGLDPGRAVGRPLDDWVVAADVAGVRQCLDQARAAGEATVEAGWRMADGSRAAVELHLRALAEPSGGGVLVAVWDVTDRVRRAGERWRRTFDAMVDGVAVVSSSGRIELANLALENHLEAVQRDLLLRPGAGGAQDWQLRSRGRLLQCALSAPADLDHRVLVVRDITDATEAEGRLREAEKMEAVATLASGVAHDFNNLLAAILLQVRWLEREPEAVSEATAAVRGLAEEGSEVVHELLLFARREGTPARPLDVAAAVRDQEPVLRHLVTDAVALEIDTPPTPVPVVGSPVALRRMVLNLVLNARDAVANAGGAVTVRVGADDGRALIEVIDDGPGIPAEHRERIFEPFYSLRRYGRGAGLGLAVVHRVVTDHGGRLTVESPTGGGTRVAVYLPMCRPEELDADEPHGSDDRALVVGPGREAAEVMEWLADLGVESRHASSADELAELLADWRPTVIVAAGDSQPEVPGCGGLPVIHAGNPAAVAAALASAARARLATDGVDGRLR
jgi:PAS domain S-box-containing protein